MHRCSRSEPSKRPAALHSAWGKYDPSFQIAETDAIKLDVPNAEVHIVDGGHFALDTAADAMADHLRQFLSK